MAAAPLALIEVRKYGATGRGETLESPAIQRAIDAET
jgi:polygalacturonase